MSFESVNLDKRYHFFNNKTMSEQEVSEHESENRFDRWKLPLLIGFFSLFAIAVIFRIVLNLSRDGSREIEFQELASASSELKKDIKVDIAGAVERPGVYTLVSDSRIQDLLLVAGGLSQTADRTYVARQINLAAKLTDGSKVYIPLEGEQTKPAQPVSAVQGASSNTSNNIININTASVAELDTLPGVGEVTVGKIVTNRPFQKIEELLEKKIVNKSTWEKIKELISVF